MKIIRIAAAALMLAAVFPTTPVRASTPSNGWVVWASNRNSGRHEIYRMKSDGTDVRRLTSSGARFPGWSPDGQWIAYTYAPDSSTHVMRHNGLGDKKICNGEFEFWMWDGSGLVCRRGDDHYLVNANSGASRVLFRKSDFSRLSGKVLNPSGISHDGRWLVAHTDLYRSGYAGSNGTFRAHHAAIVLDRNDRSKVYFFGDGCEPTTPPSGSNIYHVCGNGPCASHPDPYRMSLGDLASRSSYRAEIAHGDSDWGHEYFPRISNDNQWMAYGASTGCHDHNSCDYEIFIHRLGAGNSDRTRITNNSSNDHWPDLWVGTLPDHGCTLDVDCDDGDSCTTDACAANHACEHTTTCSEDAGVRADSSIQGGDASVPQDASVAFDISVISIDRGVIVQSDAGVGPGLNDDDNDYHRMQGGCTVGSGMSATAPPLFGLVLLLLCGCLRRRKR